MISATVKSLALAIALWAIGQVAYGQICEKSDGHETTSCGSDVEAAVDSESAARAAWSNFMAHNPMPADGCFQASYPSIVWEKVDCNTSPPRVHPTPRPTNGDQGR